MDWEPVEKLLERVKNVRIRMMEIVRITDYTDDSENTDLNG